MNAISSLPVHGRLERFGRHTLVLADSRDWIAALDADAVVSDVPYGIAFQNGAGSRSGSGRGQWRQGQRATKPIAGDDRPFDPEPLLRFREVLIWGAEHYCRRLPEEGRWLAWNKLGDIEPWDDYSDVEFAWLNKPGASKIFSHLWKGLAQKGAGTKRHHPTQKPVELMAWCLGFIEGRIILDPYMGAGTTGLACHKLGRKFIGIEQDPEYFDAACRRMDEMMRQPDLLISTDLPPTIGTTEGLL